MPSGNPFAYRSSYSGPGVDAGLHPRRYSRFNYGSGRGLPQSSGPYSFGMGGSWGQSRGQNFMDIPPLQTQNPMVNLPGGMMGGGTTIEGVGSRQNPNAIPLIQAGLDFSANRERLFNDLLQERMRSGTSMTNVGMQTGSQDYATRLQHEAAMRGLSTEEMIAQARYGQGGLESQALGQARSEMESRERLGMAPLEFRRELFASPLVQSIFGGQGGGQMYGLSGASMGGGMGEQLMARRELAAGGRRAADEAASLRGSTEFATGPGGGGMAAGPADTVAANRARLMRLQTAATERQAERQRMMEMQLAQRGQNLGLVGGMFS